MAAHQASLSFTVSQSLLKLTSIELVTPSVNSRIDIILTRVHLILMHTTLEVSLPPLVSFGAKCVQISELQETFDNQLLIAPCLVIIVK